MELRSGRPENAWGAAPDGEEYFAMALFFAAHRWGNGEGLLNYEAQARELLHTCLHKGEDGSGGRPMWDPSNHLIRFITEEDFFRPQLPSAPFLRAVRVMGQ